MSGAAPAVTRAPAVTGGRPAVTRGAVAGVALAVLTVGYGAVSLADVLVLQRTTSTAAFAGVTAVSVDTSAGDVEVVGDGGPDARVERRETWTFRRASRSEHVDGGVLHLAARCRGWFGPCGMSYVLHVPPGAAVRVRSGSGDVTARDTAALDVRTGSGTLRASGVRGEVTARAGSGDVRLSSVAAARVTAVTGSGSVSVDLADAPDAVALTSGSGDVTALLPDEPGVAYAVSTHTGSGDTGVSVRTDPRSRRTVSVRSGPGDLRIGYR